MPRKLSVCLAALVFSWSGWAFAQSAPQSAAEFFELFQAKNDRTWSGGDQVTSLRASNGLVYWSFGDTVLGSEDAATGAYSPGWEMIANTILLQRGGRFEATSWGAAVPDPSPGERYWTQGMFEANNHLYVLCQRVRNTTDFFELRGVELAKFAFNPDGTLAFRGMIVTPSSGKTNANSPAEAQYAADALVRDGYVYIFGYANLPNQQFEPQRSYVARVPVKDVEQAGAWRFQRDGGIWDASMERATPLLNDQLSSVRLIKGDWVFAYKPWHGFGDTIVIERRKTLHGPVLARLEIASPGGITPGGRRYQTYSPQLHPEQALASGKLLLSIAWNGGEFADIAADADLYKPRFQEIVLP